MYNIKIYKKNHLKSNSIPSKNIAIFNNYYNLQLNFKNHLKKENSLIFNNCDELEININTNISRIEFYNCKNIILTNKKILGGIIIKNSDISLKNNDTIYNLEIEYSNLSINSHNYKKIKYKNNFYSNIFI